MSAADFWPAFVVISLISLTSFFSFYRLPNDAGHQVSGRKVEAMEGPKAADTVANETTADVRDQRLG